MSLRIDDVHEGMAITPQDKHPTNAMMFRFSAITWNAHRIHYDLPHAESEGYPGVIVHAHLHGCFLVQTVLDWAGSGARLRRFRWENRRYAIAGDVLTCAGRVTGVISQPDGGGLVECELEERNQDGELCVPAWATVELAARAMGRNGGSR